MVSSYAIPKEGYSAGCRVGSSLVGGWGDACRARPYPSLEVYYVAPVILEMMSLQIVY